MRRLSSLPPSNLPSEVYNCQLAMVETKDVFTVAVETTRSAVILSGQLVRFPQRFHSSRFIMIQRAHPPPRLPAKRWSRALPMRQYVSPRIQTSSTRPISTSSVSMGLSWPQASNLRPSVVVNRGWDGFFIFVGGIALGGVLVVGEIAHPSFHAIR